MHERIRPCVRDRSEAYEQEKKNETMVVEMNRLGGKIVANTLLELVLQFLISNTCVLFRPPYLCLFLKMPLCLTISARLPTVSKEVIAVYEPLGLRSDNDIVAETIAQLHDQAFELYRKRLFSQAAEKFAQAKRLCRENPDRFIRPKPSAVLHRRCVQFMSQPPPRDWDLVP